MAATGQDITSNAAADLRFVNELILGTSYTWFHPHMQFPSRCNVLFHNDLILNSKKEIVKRRIRFLKL